MAFLFAKDDTIVSKPGKQKKLAYKLNTLKAGTDLRTAVQVPAGEKLDDWLAFNTQNFMDEVNALYEGLADSCTAEACPTMSAGETVEFHWADEKSKKPTRVNAATYVENALAWIDVQLKDPKIFVVDEDAQYPKDFQKIVKKIFKYLFRIYAHIYHSHFAKMQAIGADAHLNSCFKLFISFSNEFQLIEKFQLEPMQDLIDKMLLSKQLAGLSMETADELKSTPSGGATPKAGAVPKKAPLKATGSGESTSSLVPPPTPMKRSSKDHGNVPPLPDSPAKA